MSEDPVLAEFRRQTLVLEHAHLIEGDVDFSDSVRFTLAASSSAVVTLKGRKGYVTVLKEYATTSDSDTTYSLVIGTKTFTSNSPADEYMGLGLALQDVDIDINVSNGGGASRTYITSVKGIYRPKDKWKYPLTLNF